MSMMSTDRVYTALKDTCTRIIHQLEDGFPDGEHLDSILYQLDWMESMLLYFDCLVYSIYRKS